MFKPNQEKIQEGMFQKEMDFNREQQGLDMDKPEDDVIYLDQKEKNEDLTRWQQNLYNEIEQVVHDIKREVENERGNWVKIDKDMKPLMNEMGVASFRIAVRPLLSRNLMMSNYNEEMILTKLKGIVFTYISHLTMKYEEYEIEQDNLSLLIRIFRDLIEPAHFRCLNNGERNYLNTINKRVEAIAYSQNPQVQQKKGWLGGII